MTKPLAVRHGAFGRATLNRLDRPLATHAHREGHIIVTLRGSGSAIESEGERLALEPDRAVLIDPWRPHRFVPVRGRPSEFLTLYIEPDWFRSRGGTALAFGGVSTPINERLAELADDIAAMLPPQRGRMGGVTAVEGAGPDGATATMGNDDLEAAIARLALALHDRSHHDRSHRLANRHLIQLGAPSRAARTGPDRAPLPRTVGDFRIRRAMRLLRAALESEMETDLDVIAREAGLSRPHFFKLFREHVGVTPGTFQNALKMERSYERLAAGTDTVTSIGLDLGFASQASFTRFFIAQSGIAPTDYRQALAARAAHNETVGYA